MNTKISLLPIVATVGALSACSPDFPTATSPDSPRAASPNSATAASPAMCAEFDSVIDRNIVDIAVSEIDGSSDKSAIQQGARFTENSNRLSTIMINIQLQAQNRCPPRQKPIDASIYRSHALKCWTSRMGYGSYEDEKTAAAAKARVDQVCDLKTWETPAKK